LIAAFEIRGWKFSLGTEAKSKTMEVEVFNFSIPFRFEEKLERREHILTLEEKKDKVKNPWKYERPLYDHVPTGLLILRIGEKHTYGNPGYRIRWSDGKRMKMEKEIGDFCRVLILAAIKKRNNAIESEIRKRKWEEEEKRRQKLAFLQQLDERRVENLRIAIDSYEMMVKTQGFVSYVRERAIAQGKPLEGDLAAWIEWAEKYTIRCDPLRIGYPQYDVRKEWEMR